MKRKALLSSILTIALCLCLIAGSTFALFTNESKVNIAITAGNVEVIATLQNASTYSPAAIDMNGDIIDATNAAPDATSFVNGGSAKLDGDTLTLTKVTPGDKVNFEIKIENKSNVAISYRTIISCKKDDGLFEGLAFDIGGTKAVSKTDWAPLAVGEGDKTLTCCVELPADAGNDYQEKSCTISFAIEAVQGNAEMPSEWDGKTVTDPKTDNDGVYQINTADEFVSFITTVAANGKYCHATVSINKDIDLDGATIKTTAAQQNRQLDGVKIEGNGHTISNFTIDSTANPKGYYGGLFGYMAGYHDSYIKDLNVRNATVIGGKQTGVIVGGINGDNSTVENCKVYDCTIIGTKKVGAVVGYTANGIVKDCYAENCNVYCAENDANECGEVIGFINTVDTGCVNNTSGNTSKDVTINYGVAPITVSNAAELKSVLSTLGNGYAVLINDIDLENQEWTPVTLAGEATFDGNGYTIRNLKVTTNGAAGLFDWTYGVIKNLTIDGAIVTGNHYVGALVGYAEKGSVEDCAVKNAVIKSLYADNDNDGDKAGALIGHLNSGAFNPTVKNCKAEDCKVYAVRDAGQLVGCAKEANVTGCSVTNVAVSTDSTGAPADYQKLGENINEKLVGRAN